MQKDNDDQIRRMGAYLTIPFVMAVPPILGWYLGKWLDHTFNTSPYLTYILLLAGLCAAFRELYRIIKRFGDGA